MNPHHPPFDMVVLTPSRGTGTRLALAACRAGALGVLDSGSDPDRARRAAAELAEATPAPFGVLLRSGVGPTQLDLPDRAVLVLPGPGYELPDGERRTVLAQVTSVEEARAAAGHGVTGLIAKGTESGDRVGTETSLVLLQRLLQELDLPVWVQGGVGLHSGAACVAGGAAGVVLDAQLALVRESELPEPVVRALGGMDGSETTVISGFRVFSRPDLEPVVSAGAGAAQVEAALGCEDPRRQLLPAGQDLALARPLAERFVTAGGVITAIRRSIRDSLEAARRAPSVAAGSPLAREHRLQYPILQGPMTRVSDTALFADAVSHAGALPFIALSMLRADAARELLTETKRLLGDRTWGVGILGFVPQELRDEQLAAIRETRPPVVLIAGGRPSQARPLEAEGIATYLHVPSPGLLDMFLKDGARRFVFEGRECGGHVGPRTSLVLWELQLQRLLTFERPEELSIVFAGGIHDARSAAMIAALSAPLAERGARIGILMGTAYLFTREAVDCGAIQSAYQAAAVDCDATVLLETAPGHATRCVDSPYVRAFVDERRRLEAEGLDAKEVWARLEMLNLGRLRIASKGLKREGGELVTVDPAGQRTDGMYMIGEVASLRAGVTTAAELHRQVSDGAIEHLERLALPEDGAPGPGPADVAIIGMACVFPDAPDVEAYWSNIVKGVDSITEVDPRRWNPELYYDPDSRGGDRTPSKWGGFISDVLFDPLHYGIPPQSLTAIDPTQLISLEMARRALADAGYAAREFDRSRVAVVFGAESGTDLSAAYGFRALYRQYAGALPPELDEHLPRLTEDSFPGVLANVIAGRIANRLDLRGGNFTVDAACASSLAAVDVALKELATGSADMVLCGGADLHNGINDYLLFAGVHALSRRDRCRTFDAETDGIILGEGVACLVLKRLADAERDGDRIYAVIKSVGSSSDGRSLGLTAPRKEGQKLALERAYAYAGVSPREIGLIEAHATGTVVGDRTELGTLTETFEAAGAERGACGLGSVKSQIGHTKCAAGLAGIIKVAMALHKRVLPPTINIQRPNPGYDPTGSPFALSDAPRPWTGDRRNAGVSAFGFGGSNFHAVLSAYEEHVATAGGFSDWPAELFLFRGADRDEALGDVRRLVALLAAAHAPRLRDLAASVGRDPRQPVQLACVAGDTDELRGLLDAALGGAERNGLWVREPVEGRVAFLFPGQGSQRPGMLRELFVAFPSVRQLLDSDPRWAERILPPTAWTEQQRDEQMRAVTDTRVAQPALGIADLALADLLGSCGVAADDLGGHSYGELVALCAAGALSRADLLPVSEERAAAILEAAGDDPGRMAAVAADAATVAEQIAGIGSLVVANENSPRQTVISGPAEAVEAGLKRLAAAGLSAKRIPVACAFHSPVVAAATERLARRLESLEIGRPDRPVWSNATAEPYPEQPDAVRRGIARQLALPVKFVDQVRSMYERGARVFVEVGPGRVLTGLVGTILGERPHLAVACDGGRDAGLRDLLTALARLAAAGLPVDAAPLFGGRGARPLVLSDAAALTAPATSWKINGWLARPVSGGVPKNALKPTPQPVVRAGTTAAPVAGSREAAVVDYLRNLRELAAAQRDVMLGYLGAPAVPAARVIEAEAVSADRVDPAPPTAGEPPSAPTVAPPTAEAIARSLTVIVSERTGYPEEMLGLDMDLEAELSIDSIKRVEILGELSTRLGLDQGSDEDRDYVIEQLAARKTLREIVVWLEERAGAAAATSAEAGAPASAAAPVVAVPEVEEIERELTAIVSERTGYPEEMLGFDMDLEAELSIDSIKRVEILGELSTRLGLDQGSDEDRDRVIEQLAARKTLREIVAWLEESLQPAATAPGTTEGPDEAIDPAAFEVRRFVVSIRESPIDDHDSGALAGKRLALSDRDHAVSGQLAALLESAGAAAVDLPPDGALDGVDGVVYLGALRRHNGSEPAKELFAVARRAVASGAAWFFAVTAHGGRFGRDAESRGNGGAGGVAGLLKSLAKENPGMRVRIVDTDSGDHAKTIAAQVFAELATEDDAVEVGYRHGTRCTLDLVATDPREPANGSFGLDDDAVVLVTGGARGITAAAVVELARRTRGHLELVGRSPLPGDESPGLADAHDAPALRRALVARGDLEDPAKIEAECRAILRAREIRATLDAIREAGASVRYHALDVRDAVSFGALIDEIYARMGRIDLVLHGAGVIEDKLLRDKTEESFARVYDTKVSAARTLVAKLRDDVKGVVFFSSVSGVFGNRGQVDYAAAGDALDKIALELTRRTAGRALSIDWGPWASTGMVSETLAREYARRGVGLISLEAGVDHLMRELAVGPPWDGQVLLMAADPEALSRR